MIQFFIKIANNWLGKVIFGALLFGMVFVLGYGGILSMEQNIGDAVVVGNRQLSMKQLDEALRQEHKRLTALAGSGLTLKQAIEMGLLDNVVQDQTNQMIAAGIKDELGLTASNDAVRKYIEQNPVFADAAGHFDRNLFLAYVRQSGLNERSFAKKLQDELATQHLSRTLRGLAYAPAELVRVIHRHQFETRDVTALFVETDRLAVSDKPTGQELQDYYDVYAPDLFATPEYRTFKYVRLTPEMLLSRVKVSDQELAETVSTRQGQYGTPEKRQVRQLFFADEESARQIAPDVTAKTFDEIAKTKLGQSEDLTDFGYVAKNELTETLADAVFAAQKGQIIGPLSGPTGWHLVWVKDIRPAEKVSETEIKKQLRDQLAGEKVYGIYEDTVRRLEEMLGEGKSLDEAAKALSFKVQSVAGIDIAGNRADGQTLDQNLSNRDLIQSLFTLKVGEVSPLFDNGNGIIVAELTEVIPVGIKSFETVRPELEKKWISDKKKELLQPTVDKLLKRVAAGSNLKTVGSFQNYKLVHKPDLKRTDSDVLPDSVLQAAFRQKTGSENITTVPTEDGMYIIVVGSITYPDLDKQPDLFNQTREAVLDQTGSNLITDVTAAYADKLGVQVRQDAIRKAFSGYLTQQD